MVQISDLIIAHPEITSFEQLEELVKEAARRGEIHLSFDLKPEYQDTPRKWQDRLETAFTSIIPGAADERRNAMDGEEKERLETLIAPFGREVRLDEVRFESGLKLLRVTIREGKRITQLDVDAQTALAWAKVMKLWGERETERER